MTETHVSVVVVSHGRPAMLTRCVRGIAQLAYRPFELVVVADPAGLTALRSAGLAGRAKCVSFPEANISAARNAGIAQAAGEILAFIDDDAAPEPGWLTELIAPFSDKKVAAAGGYVLGRNGISLQWGARGIGRDARHEALDLEDDAASVIPANRDLATRTEGTNMAFRRKVLTDLGGFDEAYRFYLEDADLNMRLAAKGLATAIVPTALVHHASAPSARRNAARCPRDLTEIGASLAVFLSRHGEAPSEPPEVETAEQYQRLIRHLIAGNCEPRDPARIMESFSMGYAGGLSREPALREFAPAPPPFRHYRTAAPAEGTKILAGRIWEARKLRARAVDIVQNGGRASVFLFSPTAFYHRARFTEAGYWEQTGGIFGRSNRSEPIFRLMSFKARVEKEVKNIFLRRLGYTK
ncbi:MAG: glycosyltransferase [Rhodobacteraceae bacterium]|nr:glycosyltransferase [Paracoccaceae bacterium]